MFSVGSALEGRLRSLPGVLDCSLNDAGVALLVHPEIDTRLLKARAQAIFAEMGDPRPLVLVGGYPAKGRRGAGAGGGLRRFGRADATPLSLVVFAILVLCLLAVVPIQPGNRLAPLPTPSLEAPLAEAAFGSDLAPDLFRAAASLGRRATAAAARAAAVASGPAAAAVVVAEAPGRAEPPGRARAAARRAAAATAALAPALSIAASVAKPVCAPGNSAAHRQRLKKPKVSRPC